MPGTDKMESKRNPVRTKPGDFMELVHNFAMVFSKSYGASWSSLFVFLGTWLMRIHRTEEWKYPIGMANRWFDQVLYQLRETVVETGQYICNQLDDTSPNLD